MNFFSKFVWTIIIKSTKLEKLVPSRAYHMQIAEAYKVEFERRKKVFDESIKEKL